MLINRIKRVLSLGYSERKSICARMIILPLYIVLYWFLTKSSNLTFMGCHNVWLQFCWVEVTTSVRSLSWHDKVHTCTLTHFVPYPLYKLMLKLSFSYLWLWHISVLILYHSLSLDYFCVRLVHFCSFFFCLHAVETFFVPFYFVSTLDSILSPPVTVLNSISYWFYLTLTTFPTYIYLH